MSYANNGDNEIERMRQRRLANRIAAENGTVMDLSSLAAKHNQLPEVSTRNSKKYQQPSQPVIANLGDPPDGQEWPTHVVIGGEMFMLVPPAVFEESANTAFNRGFEMALNMYRDQIKTPKISEQVSYVDMVRRGDFDKGVEVEIDGVSGDE